MRRTNKTLLLYLSIPAILVLALISITNNVADKRTAAEATANPLICNSKDNLVDISESFRPDTIPSGSNTESIVLLSNETAVTIAPTVTSAPTTTPKPTAKPTPKPTVTPKTTTKPAASPGVENPAPSSKGKFTAEDVFMVAQLIYAEGRNQSIASFEAMANIILNRCFSKKFPKTVKGVIFQKNQFSVVKSEEKFASIKPSKRAQYAAERIFNENKRVLPRTVMFFRSARSSKKWGSRVYYATIGGNMYFK